MKNWRAEYDRNMRRRNRQHDEYGEYDNDYDDDNNGPLLCEGCGEEMDRDSDYGQYCRACKVEMSYKAANRNRLTISKLNGWKNKQKCMVCGEPSSEEHPLYIVANCSVRHLTMKLLECAPCIHMKCLNEIQQGKTHKRKVGERVIKQTRVRSKGKSRWSPR